VNVAETPEAAEVGISQRTSNTSGKDGVAAVQIAYKLSRSQILIVMSLRRVCGHDKNKTSMRGKTCNILNAMICLEQPGLAIAAIPVPHYRFQSTKSILANPVHSPWADS
jgi:hypothetical protein